MRKFCNKEATNLNVLQSVINKMIQRVYECVQRVYKYMSEHVNAMLQTCKCEHWIHNVRDLQIVLARFSKNPGAIVDIN